MNIKQKKLDTVSYWLFVLPALLLLFLICIVPIMVNFYYMMFDWNGISSTKLFVGIQNFVKLFTEDVKFMRSVKFTMRYTVFSVIITNVMSLGISVVLAGARKSLSNIGRAAYYIPCITASAASGLMWKFIFRNGTKTIYAITNIPIFAKSWIGSVDLSFYAILIVGIWSSVGFYNIIYIAALVSVPENILEAALIDGAGKWKQFWHVTFPQIFPTFSTCLLLSLINSLKVFDSIMMITEGGPAGLTTSMAYGIYETAFSQLSYGLSAAQAFIFLAALLVITAVELGVTRKVNEG